MAGKSIPVSVRLSDEDADYIAAINVPEAITVSEKIRHLIGAARRKHMGEDSYKLLLEENEAQLADLRSSLSKLSQTGQSSSLLQFLAHWLPSLIATLADDGNSPERPLIDQLKERETAAVAQIRLLIDQIARLAVADQAPCLDPSAPQSLLAPLVPLHAHLPTSKKGD